MSEHHLPDKIPLSEKDLLQKLYEENSESFIIIAHVLVEPFLSGWHTFSMDGWTVIPTSGGKQYVREFKMSSTPDDWLASITSLNKILLSYFICEFEPRIIYGFELPKHLPPEKFIPLVLVFGNSIEDSSREEQTKKSFELSTFLVNGWVSNDPHYQTDISLINEWYELFNNEIVFNCVNLIRESFVIINRQFNTNSFFNFLDICTGIVLLVSAMEGLFTNNQDNNADINFKFTTIGSFYYEKNVTEDFLGRFNTAHKYKKLTHFQFKKLLSELYSMRSAVAHGNYSKIKKAGEWKKILNLLDVHYDNNVNQAYLSKQIAIALGLFQKHILALIVQSKADLHKGVDILDEIICSKENGQ